MLRPRRCEKCDAPVLLGDNGTFFDPKPVDPVTTARFERPLGTLFYEHECRRG